MNNITLAEPMGNLAASRSSLLDTVVHFDVIWIWFFLCYFGVDGELPIVNRNVSSGSGFGQNYGGSFLLEFVLPMSFWAISAVCITLKFNQVMRVVLRNKVWMFTGVLIMASYFWSSNPKLTRSSAIAYIFTIVFCAYVVVRLPGLNLLYMVIAVGTTLAILSAIFAILVPQIGLDHATHVGAWQGVFSQKNVCGRAMTFLLAPGVVLLINTRRRRMVNLMYVTLIGFVGVMSQSRTSRILMAMIPLLFVLLKVVGRFSPLLRALSVASIVVVVAGGAIMTNGLERSSFLTLLGRDVGLTDRTKLWHYTSEAALRKPWLGFGYSAFWQSTSAFETNLAMHWRAPGAHNGYLDIFLALGVVGVSLFIMILARVLRNVIVIWNPRRSFCVDWYVGIVILVIGYSMVESFLFYPTDLIWALFVFSSLALSEEAEIKE